MQFAGSVNQQIIGNAAALEIISPIDPNWYANVYGTNVDASPQCFGSVPSQRPNLGNQLMNGLAKSYFWAAYKETPTHRQIQYATQDIPSIQLTIRGGLSPTVLAQWQLANAQIGDTRGF